ncbi:hypothetical protein AVEN_70738-1 [Araneus ventricosus]|uniref:Uncharacterized protein n=1 Tax=Araneus ventricosus TaxID=182803 RepID=A0A4Y2KK68_ARAVE|nr:hypothetical protein AVEN_70738-1 [Araneus ventricosus]
MQRKVAAAPRRLPLTISSCLVITRSHHPALSQHPGKLELPTAETDRQPLWPSHNSPHYELLMPGYDPSSEMGPKARCTLADSCC